MLLRLDPRLSLVWRSPTSIQIGVDPAVARIDDVSPTQERMIAALVAGVSSSGLAMIAGGRSDEAVIERDDLLRLVGPALLVPAPLEATVGVCGDTGVVDLVADLLAHNGLRVLTASRAQELDDAAIDIAVTAEHFVVGPTMQSYWLRRDIPHVPIVSGDRSTVIGPLVEPGRGPCLVCVELHRRDADAAWPAIISQLLGRVRSARSTILDHETAALASRMVIGRIRDGAEPSGAAASVRIEAATGTRRRRVWNTHAECGCRVLDAATAPTPPETPPLARTIRSMQP